MTVVAKCPRVNRFSARQPLLSNGWRADKRLARGLLSGSVAG